METGLAKDVKGTTGEQPLLSPDAQLRALLRDQCELLESKGYNNEIKENVKLALLQRSEEPDLKIQPFIDTVKEIPSLEFLLAQDARILEGYSIEEHTSMVLSQFERYLKEPQCPIPLSRAEIRIAALFHDIGKPLPEKKSDQHIATLEILEKYREILPLSDKSFKIIQSLIGNDPIGKFVVASVLTFASIEERSELRQQACAGVVTRSELKRFHELVTLKEFDDEVIKRAQEIATSFEQRASLLEISAIELFNLHKLFYQADTSAYTYDAVATNGRRAFPGLDYLYDLNFDVNIEHGDLLLKIDPQTGMLQHSTQVDQLLKLIEYALS